MYVVGPYSDLSRGRGVGDPTLTTDMNKIAIIICKYVNLNTTPSVSL